MLARYIGRKDRYADSIVGAVWNGHGDVREVTADEWARLAPHTTMWELVAPRTLADAFDIEAATDEQIREWLIGKPFKVHHKKTGEALREAVRAAMAG